MTIYLPDALHRQARSLLRGRMSAVVARAIAAEVGRMEQEEVAVAADRLVLAVLTLSRGLAGGRG